MEEKHTNTKKKRRWLRLWIKIISCVVVIVALLPAALYIPAVQNNVKTLVAEKVSEATGYDVEIGRFLLKFPVDVSVERFSVTAQQLDTLVSGSVARVDVRLIPLLMGDIVVRGIELENARYKMVSPDSSMLFSAKVRRFELRNATVELLTDHIRLFEASLDGADVDLIMDLRRSQPSEPDSSASADWLIGLEKLSLKDVHYRMSMMPSVDSLSSVIRSGELKNVAVNLAASTVRVGYLGVDRLSAAYLLPEKEQAEAFVREIPSLEDSVTTQQKPWTIMADSIRLRDSEALYSVRGAVPVEGLDFNYIQASNINVSIDDFYNRGSKIRIPLKGLSVDERSGLCVRRMNGSFEMDSTVIKADSLVVRTLLSEIELNAVADLGALEGNPSSVVDVSLLSDISLEEIGKVYPSLRPMLHSISRIDNAEADLQVSGTGKELDLRKLDFKVPGIVSLHVTGKAEYPFDNKKTSGSVLLSGTLSGGERIKHLAGLDSAFSVPVVRLSGKAAYAGESLDARLTAAVDSGRIVAGGRWNIRGERYSGKLGVAGFDIRSFMPYGDIGVVDGSMDVAGTGYDVYTMKARADAGFNRVDFGGTTYRDISINASINDGIYNANVISGNEFADVELSLDGRVRPDVYFARVRGDFANVDLQAMDFSERELSGKLGINGVVRADLKRGDYRGFIRLSDVNVTYGIDSFTTDSINVGFSTDSLNTRMRLRNKDLLLRMESPYGADVWNRSLSALSLLADSMIVAQSVDIKALKQKMPGFKIDMGAGRDNMLYQYMHASDVDYDRLFLDIDKDSDLLVRSYISGFVAGGVLVDTIFLRGSTRNDSLLYALHVRNSDKNSALFRKAELDGALSGNCLSAYLVQADKTGVKGFDFGLGLSVVDSVASLRLFPENPVIAYRNWQLNRDNFVSYDMRDGALQADLKVTSGENSHINIYTDVPPVKNNGINVELAGIELGDWLTLSPFSPPVDGVLSSNLKIYYNDKYVWGDGKLSVDGLYYGKNRVGNIAFDSKLAYVGNTRNIYAMADMDVDGKEVVTVRGYRNDTVPASIYDMRINMRRFPLSVINAFMPEGMGAATGYLSAGLDFSGTMDNPDIRGFARFDSTRVISPSFGAKFDFDTVGIPVDNGLIRFDKYKLYGANGNPIIVDGDFQFLPFDNMRTDLTITGKDVQVVDSKKSGMAELYGKGYADLYAGIKGYLNSLEVNASLSLRSGTDLTYVVQSATAELAQSSDDGVVEFVNFNDTVKNVEKEDTVLQKPFAMRINAMLTVQPNAVFTIYLSPDGKNRVNIDGEGSLNYSQTYQGDANMTGKYVINGGYVRYAPPMLSEKLFNFVEGGSVVWTGELLNPTLNVKAVETVKANVTTDQNSRLVPFDVSLNVGNTLNELDVTFDVSTDADMTIANELSGMTQEQRSTQAMNLLLYGSYTGGSTTTAGGLSGENMAFSFLESTLNKWAANNISGVDLSFGIDQYDKTVDGTTSTTTSYSYKVSKSIFDDRFKIVVGGNYSTDASAEDNLAQNLFNDISFEYKINKSGTAYLKLFRKTEYESILEGEITETGGGFVWRRKILLWRDMFRFFRRQKQPATVVDENGGKEAVMNNKKQDEDEQQID